MLSEKSQLTAREKLNALIEAAPSEYLRQSLKSGLEKVSDEEAEELAKNLDDAFVKIEKALREED